NAVPRYDAAVLANAPDLLEAYDREWNVMHTDTCLMPSARCALQATNLLRNADFARPGIAWRAADPWVDLQWRDGYLRATTTATAGAVVQDVPWIVSPGRAYRLAAWVRAVDVRARTTGTLELTSTPPSGAAVTGATRFDAGADWTPVSVAVLPKP